MNLCGRMGDSFIFDYLDAASGVLLYLYSEQNSQNEDIFCEKRQNLFRHGEGMQQRIEQQRKIADS